MTAQSTQQSLDKDNPVVALCSQGMRAEAEGRPGEAKALFEQAWERAGDDYEACVAAHYLARHQSTIADELHWNQVCLARADAVGDERVAAFYPSLHVCIARCHRALGDAEQAATHFRHAADRLGALPPGGYADWLRYAVAEGLRDTGAVVHNSGEQRVADLLDLLCEQRDLRSLAVLLPAFCGHTGTSEDRRRLAEAVHRLHAERRLPADAEDILRTALTALS
ncbi:hypothetical protein SAXI111661_03275 [Saccharomonospora xinjiangensis]|uniref:hypothetical protein n=1 Tax=Saccharomonospora xinjiangensis TaxID=75294 RepID=UPI0010C5A414|nr:hypothetical protein [Saccharomonospora xinjiangensis]QBQ59815.1 hypothetical protein EYD13_07245 [Saccharomonospora xinjiangensis]